MIVYDTVWNYGLLCARTITTDPEHKILLQNETGWRVGPWIIESLPCTHTYSEVDKTWEDYEWENFWKED